MKLRDFSQPPVEQLAQLLLRHAGRDARLVARCSALQEDAMAEWSGSAAVAPTAAISFGDEPSVDDADPRIEELMATAAKCVRQAEAAQRTARRAVFISAAVALLGMVAGISGVAYRANGSAAIRSAALLPDTKRALDAVPSVPLPPADQTAGHISVAEQPPAPAEQAANSIAIDQGSSEQVPPALPLPLTIPRPQTHAYVWHTVHHWPLRHARPAVPPAPVPSLLSFGTYSGGAG